jgi:hypothetical protein
MIYNQYDNLIICGRYADEILRYWCPFCDEVGDFGYMHWGGELWCMKCGETLGQEGENSWPKGLCHLCGELSTLCQCKQVMK